MRRNLKQKTITKLAQLKNMIIFTVLIPLTTSYADDGKVTLDTFSTKVNDVFNLIIGICVFVAIISIGIEFIINRKKAEERTQTIDAALWAFIGAVICALALQITKMVFFN